jgi:hypothetical protein
MIDFFDFLVPPRHAPYICMAAIVHRPSSSVRRTCHHSFTPKDMSIAEFYTEYGIDPSDPQQFDDFLRAHAESPEPAPVRRAPTFYSGLAIVHQRIERDASSRTEASSWPLNESELDYMGETRGWDKMYGLPAQPPMASYKKEGVRLNFWLSTGTVGSYLEHPRRGKTQLFRREVSMSEARDVFDNPRQHTGKGYHRKNSSTTDSGGSGNNNRKRKADAPPTYMRTCALCGTSKSNDQFSKNQRRKGSAAKCKGCV